MKRIGYLAFLLAPLIQCASVPTIQPPKFDYSRLISNFIEKNPEGHFPLTVQRGNNTDPSASGTGYLFYASDLDGSSDIWMRDLRSTVNVPLVRHPAEQTDPYVTPDGKLLAYVSFELDAGGDIRLVAVDPEAIVEANLRGEDPPNLWFDSVNLSHYLDEVGVRLGPECKGSFSEKDPVLSPKGDEIYFVSDRCNPGTYRIWSLKLEEQESESLPVPVSPENSIQPSVSGDGRYLAYLVRPSAENPPRIEILDRSSGEQYRIPLEAGPERQPFLYFRPSLSLDGKSLYYGIIRKDTNRNGILDQADDAALAGISVEDVVHNLPLPDRYRLVESSLPIYSLAYSTFLNGTLLYAADQFNTVNIYVTPRSGMIPGESRVDQQYEKADSYQDYPARYALALEAVSLYHSDSPFYFLYEGKSLYRLRRALQTLGAPDEIASLDRRIAKSQKDNPVARLDSRIYSQAVSPGNKAALLQGSIGPTVAALPKEQQSLANAYLLEELARAQWQAGNGGGALATLETLNQRFPDYFRHYEAATLQGQISLAINHKIPEIFRTIIQDEKLPTTLRESVLTSVFDEFESRTPAAGIASVDRNLPESNPQLRSALLIAKGRLLQNDRDYIQAIEVTQKGLEGVPDQTGLYVRGWQTLAFAFEAQQNTTAAYDAKLKYGGSYRPGSGVSISAQEFQGIVEESEALIRLYRDTARSIYSDIQDRSTQRYGIVGVELDFSTAKLPLKLGDREVLRDYCKPDSAARNLLYRLGQKDYFDSYNNFCAGHPDFLSGRTVELPFEDAQVAADLLYLTSYANANTMNILFLFVKKVDLFPELYDRKAIYFHRLKVDLAVERNKKRLAYERKKREIISPDQIADWVSESDPFEARIFNELVYGYRHSAQEARDFFDHSLIYGYAYTLVQKSVERERFYDSVLKKGNLSRGFLRTKKEAVLRDLKEAEYQLQYILYVEPENVDAYLLLGWLYQYVDERRESQLLIEPGYEEQLFSALTGIRPAEYQDGTEYRELYLAYFPDRLYEKNVELYNQALTRLGSTADPAGRALLHLNLANNHFKLLNFKRASEHYRDFAALKDASSKKVFSGYLQEALYYFNRGRAAYYEGEVDDAALDLERARQVFEKEEFEPVFQKYTELKFRTSGPEYPAYLKNNLEEATEELLRSRYRLALISSLRGLALSEAGKYREAISAYREAEYLLYKQEPQVADGVDRSGLLNFIAMSYQAAGSFESSNQNAELAEKVSLNKGLDREDRRYEPQTIGGRALGCLLSYGEDFSVIGEGRTPYGFSSLRQYELSLGIQLENAVMLGDLDHALSLIEKRQDVFESEDGDVALGRAGILSSMNQKAINLVNLQRFDEAHEAFQEAAEKALDWNFLESFFSNFKNSYVVLFMAAEAGDPIASVGNLRDSFALLENQKIRYAQEIKKDYIDEKTTEDPDFSYNESRDDPVVQERVNQRLVDFLVIEGQLHYYIALHAAKNRNKEETAQEADRAKELFDRALKALKDEGRVPGFEAMRAQLNRARTLLLTGDSEAAIRELNELADETYEYNALREYWATYRSLGDAYASKKDFGAASRNYDRSLQILKDFPDLRYRVANRLSDYFDSLAAFYIQNGRYRNAMQSLELKRQVQLQNQFLRYPLRLSNAIEDEQHRVMMEQLGTLSRTARQESIIRLRHEDPDSIARYNDQLRSEFKYVQTNLAQSRPLLRPFLLLDESVPIATRGDVLVQFVDTSVASGCLVNDGSIRFVARASEDNEAFVLSCMPEKAERLILIANSAVFQWRPDRIIQKNRPDLPDPVYSTTVMDLRDAVGYIQSPVSESRNIWNAGPAFIPESNRIFVDDVPTQELFAGRENPGFDLRKAIAQRQSAAILFANLENSPSQYIALRNAYEVFRASGGSSVVLVESEEEARAIQEKAGKSPYGEEGAAVFGISGFDRGALEQTILADSRQSAELAKTALYEGDNQRAALLASRSLSLTRIVGKKDGLEGASLLNRALGRMASENGAAIFEETLKQTSPDEALLLYSERIRGLYEAGQIEIGNSLSSEFAARYPERRQQMETRLRSYLSLAILEKSDRPATALKGAGLSLNFEQYLESDRDRIAAAQSLIRHGATDRAEKLLANSFSREAIKWKGEARIEAALIGKGKLSPEDQVASDTAFLIVESLAGRWKFYEDMVNNLPATNPEEVGEHRKNLLLQWENSRKGNPISFEQLRCIPVKNQDLSARNAFTAIQQVLPNGKQIQDLVGLGGASETTCLHLPASDRALMFQLLIRSVQVDPGLQIAGMLEQLIQAESAYSRARASWFALVASEAYLDKMDADTGFRFYEMHLNLRDASLESDQVRRGRLALWYRLYGKAIPDNLLSEFMGVTPVRKIAEMTIGLPSEPDRRDYGKIERELEKGSGIPNLREERNLAMDLLKRRAIKENSWKTLANLEFYQDELLGAGDDLPAMKDIAGSIIQNIPEGQKFTVLIDAGSTFYVIDLSRSGLEHRDIGVNAREMRANLEEFKRRIQSNQPNERIATTLSDFYRSILPGNSGKPGYYWFPAMHSLAPVVPRTGDQLYQVLDPATIAESEPYRASLQLSGDFRILQGGQPGYYPEQDPALDHRLDQMELSALENTTVGAPVIAHLFSGSPHAGIYSNQNLPYFLSDSYLIDLSAPQVRDLFVKLARNTNAPGIISLARPPGTAHPFFVKNLYDRTLPNGYLYERYVHAFALLVRNFQETGTLYGYRLVTSRWIAP